MSATATDPNLQHLTQAREQIAQGDLKNAALTLNKANAQWPQDPRVFMLGGLLAEKAGNVQGAFDALRKSVSLAPDWGPGLLELALLLARQNQFPEAIETAEKVAALEPKNLQVLAGVIDIAHRAVHLEMAVRHLRRGLRLVHGDITLRRLLASDLSDLGQHSESLEIWDELVKEYPTDLESLVGRVKAYIAAGQPVCAKDSATTLLEMAPNDRTYQYYSKLTRGETPDQQPVELTSKIFDNLAEFYDWRMVRGLKYQLPKQVSQLILERHPDRKINVLDLGCGTGLLGVFLGRLDGALMGVDPSRKMIEQAARHNVYDRFHTVNLHDALRETPDKLYQVITALDVFIYAGDVKHAIPNMYRVLTPGGMMVLSFETAAEQGADMVLQPNGRYAHKRSHLQALCQSAGFTSVEIENVVLREENRQPVDGFTVVAYKAV